MPESGDEVVVWYFPPDGPPYTKRYDPATTRVYLSATADGPALQVAGPDWEEGDDATDHQRGEGAPRDAADIRGQEGQIRVLCERKRGDD